jgi:salicylate hydroxylase
MEQHKKIAIIGGGIGGAALALSLQQKGLTAKVYEGDESFDVRKQGYLQWLDFEFLQII